MRPSAPQPGFAESKAAIGTAPLRPCTVVALFLLWLSLSGCGTTHYPMARLEPDLRARIHTPATEGPHPAVLLLHGSGGIREEYHEEAAYLAGHGYVVLVLDYYEDVGLGGLSGAERQRRWSAWQDEVVAAHDYLRAQPTVMADRIAAVGYSQGAAVAISTAHRLPQLRAIVDFFGPNVEGWYIGGVFGNRALLPADYLDRMPPVLILHGSADPIVPKGDSQQLHDALLQRGRTVELQIYKGSLHAFISPISGTEKGRQVAQDARERMVRFLDKHTGKPGE